MTELPASAVALRTESWAHRFPYGNLWLGGMPVKQKLFYLTTRKYCALVHSMRSANLSGIGVNCNRLYREVSPCRWNMKSDCFRLSLSLPNLFFWESLTDTLRVSKQTMVQIALFRPKLRLLKMTQILRHINLGSNSRKTPVLLDPSA